ncbi:DUF1294 domain-containing protein [bacterium]|nr:DUF1294 domain-containing protein [bacterium]
MRNRWPPDVPFLLLWLALVAGGYFGVVLYVPLPFAVPWYVTLFVAINASTFVLYGVDKVFAAAGAWRVPERTLQVTAFLLGSPGALIAMNAFRHKTRKTSFQLVLALLVLLQVLIVIGALAYFDPNFLPNSFFG